MYNRVFSLFLCAQMGAIFTLKAATFTVTTATDGGAGSLRQAIVDANANAGPDVIGFDISPAGEKTITLSNALGALPAIIDPVTIDGTTQPGFVNKAIVEISGASVFSAVDGLKITTTNCVIRGLAINRFRSDGIEISGGGFNLVEGCILGLNLAGTTDAGNSASGLFITNSPGNRVGGATPEKRNIISGNDNHGIRIDGAGSISNVIAGNIIGLDLAGAADRGNTVNGVYINGGVSNVIGGASVEARNVISGNDQAGVLIEGAGAERNWVIGNYIGVDATGAVDLGNGSDGVRINLVGNNRIGGTAGQGNLISGNNSDGVEITGATATNNVVFGNSIGLSAGGSGIANSGNGVLITASASWNTVGAAAPGLGNAIGFNNGDGVYVQSGTNNTIRANLFSSNGGLGIDLDPNSPTANDAGDSDGGANLRQNFPALATANASDGMTRISGTLNSAPLASYTIDFYGVTTLDASGAGEGEQYLGDTIIATDESGNASFSVELPVAVSGRYVTATATDDFGNTSEFSPNIDVATSLSGTTFTVTTTADAGAGSLRQAILDANTAAGLSRIDFNIPGDGPHTIAPLTVLPGISNSVVLDGYTQPGASANTDAAAFNGTIKIILSGASAASGFDGLSLQWPGTTVRGLNIVNMKGGGDGVEISAAAFLCAVEGCVIGMSLNSTNRANGGAGVYINNSKQNRIGGTDPAQRNVISGNNNAGILMEGAGCVGNLVCGNNIGTTLDGLAKLANNNDGIRINGGASNVIGGMQRAARNVISGNSGEGIEIDQASATNNSVQGNFIGPDVNGTLGLRNTSHGIYLASSRMTTIGGGAPGANNLIAYNDQDGVYVNGGTNNTIRANSIHSNNGLGIDLDPNNVNANDVGDADTGSNQKQNYPFITSAVAGETTTTVTGSLSSGTNATYTVDFYANVSADPIFNGEGEQYLGSTSVTTGADGNVTFAAALPSGVVGKFICATATDAFGNTSEFGPCFAARSTVAGQTFTVTTTADSGIGSLRTAILNANALFNSGDRIVFDIPGAGPHTIAVASALPVITDSVTIDGYTETGATQNTSASGFNGAVKIVLSGAAVSQSIDGLNVQWHDVVVRGLNILGFRNDGIEVGSGVKGFVLEGCLIGMALDGSRQANGQNGVYLVGATEAVIGGAVPAARNVISGNNRHGIEMTASAAGTRIVGNIIGLGIDGATRIGNSADGISINNDAHDTIVGGAADGERNFISGNSSDGIEINGLRCFGNLILGNFIGTDASGKVAAQNSQNGILVANNARDNRIGGSGAAEGNRIAFNGGDGITLNGATNNAVRANVIFGNGDIGIDIANNGATANDAGDVDAGPNNTQNFPALTSAMANASNTTIRGTLNSRADTAYELDFFSNNAVEGNGISEGEKFLGSATVTTDGSGNVAFEATVSGVVNGRYITATATDPDGNTSEFSKYVRAESTIPAPTLVVTTTEDAGAGSLRQALLDASNYVAGEPVKIDFNIPGAGPHFIYPQTQLPTPTEAIFLNGYSQPGASANTLALGNDAVLKINLSGSNTFTAGLRLTNSGNIVRGLAIVQFGQDGIALTGNSNRVEGCFIGIDSAGVARGNYPAGIRITPANPFSNPWGGTNNLIGGNTPAARNVISANSSYQVVIENGGSGNVVQGNYIGTNPAGTEGYGTSFVSAGVQVFYAPNVLIGGAGAGEGNLISGNNSGTGISVIDNGSPGTRILGNIIGADASGTKAVSNDNAAGVLASGASGVTIGGVNAGEANIIAFSNGNGVQIEGSSTNVLVRGNPIFSNGGLGINLNFDSVTQNDVDDVDSGPNDLQNFPVIASAQGTPNGTTVAGTLNSRPNSEYRIDLFANVLADASGYGEGQQYLGSTTATTGAEGNATFNFSGAAVIVGRFIAATATDAEGSTSEFSRAFEAATTFPAETFVVTNTNDSGAGSLRQTILDNNRSRAGANNLISFNIPGEGPHTITPATPLDAPTHAVTIDGFTQSGASANTLEVGNDSVLKIRLDGVNTFQPGLTLRARNTIVRGLSITRFSTGVEVEAASAQVAGCWLGVAPDGTAAGNQSYGIYINSGDALIGGTNAADRNVISGNNSYGIGMLNATSGSRVQGNYIGTNPSGLAGMANGTGVLLSGANHVVGGTAAGARNVISGNGQDVYLTLSTNATIEGNFIGPDATGMARITGSLGSGVLFASGSPGNLVRGNVISGHGYVGVQIYDIGSVSNRIVGNLIGLAANGANALPNSGAGIAIGIANNQIGGDDEADGNVIAYNGFGVQVSGATGVGIRKNRFIANGFDAIELSGNANHAQSAPVIAAATIGVSDVQISGFLQSAANGSFALDFYANAAPDPSGFGEGEQYLGSATVNTSAGGRGDFSVTFPKVAVGRFITATATDSENNTSEFSAAFRAGSSRPLQTFVVTTEADSGAGSLRQALLDAGNFHTAGPNKIQFNIPGDGVHVINVASQLPTPMEPVEIDGFTQPGAKANTDANIDNAVRLIAIRGAQLNSVEDGLRLSGPGNIVRGLVVSEFPNSGILLDNADQAVIESSLISSNRNAGIAVRDTVGAKIGGSVATRNVIFGNWTYGVWISSASFTVGRSADNRILGNFIGAGVNGTNSSGRNHAWGVMISPGMRTQIGGTAPGEGNLIAYNGRGVTVQLGTGNTIRGNQIFANSSLAIDLGGSGVSQNDAGDADTGANDFQNFPIVQSVSIANGGTRFIGALNSVANADFTIDFYGNDTCDLNGYGEGARYVTSIAVKTDASGNANFDTVLPFRAAKGVITATATDAAGNTSEFSACVTVGTEIPAQVYLVTTTNDAGPGSLRQAILDANDAFTISRSMIAFNIAGNGVQVISPATPLPEISNTIYVNGFTQPGAQPNTSTNSINAVLTVRIDGATLGGTNEDGLTIAGNDVLVRGLIVTRFTGAGVAVINATNVTVTECFLGSIDAGVTAPSPSPSIAPPKKLNLAADGEDPYGNLKLLGNRYGLRVKGGRDFSTAPLLAGIFGLFVAGNTEAGVIFQRAVAAQLTYAFIMYNGGFDECSGGVWLRGTSGALLQYLYIMYNFPYGVQIDNTRTALALGTLIRNCWLRHNSLQGMGAAIYADRAPLGSLDNSWLRGNLNHGVHLRESTSSGFSGIYGTMFVGNAGAAVLLDKSYYSDIGGSSESQQNTFLKNTLGVVSYGSRDNQWYNNKYGLYNTPLILNPMPAHNLTVTKAQVGDDTILTISGRGESNQVIGLVLNQVEQTPNGPAYTPYASVTVKADANGNFTTTYRQPTSTTTPDIGVIGVFDFLDCTEMMRAVAAGETGDLITTLTGKTPIAIDKPEEYTATISYKGSATSQSASVVGGVDLPLGVTIESVTTQAGANSLGGFSVVGNSLSFAGDVHAGESITIKFTINAAQVGTIDMRFKASVIAGEDSIPANNEPQLAVRVVSSLLLPGLAYSFDGDGLQLRYDSDAVLESTTDVGSGEWHPIAGPSPTTVVIDPTKQMEFFRARTIF